MLLIADSGSTKCDWALQDKESEVLSCSTMGFNPYFHDENTITRELSAQADLIKHVKEVKEVYFYGAGCSSEELNGVVKRALKTVFINAEIHVDHDLLGAALATYDNRPGIACILGTGSNSCFFDGEQLSEEVPALAYILGDEGSGSYFGKKLLSAYLYKKLPEHILIAFKEKYKDLSKNEIVDKVYRKAHANVYLASFMTFFSGFKEDPWVKDLVFKGMKEFLEIHVCCYQNCHKVPVHFVGSIAYYFEDQLKLAASELNLTIGRIVKKPIIGLVDYHLKKCPA